MPRHKSLLAIGSLVAVALGATTLSGAFGAPVPAPDAELATPSSGCGKAPSLKSGTHSIRGDRSYRLDIPDNYDNSHPYRLVFAFHWIGGTAEQVASGGTDGEPWAYYGLKQLSNNSTIFIAPQGVMGGWANAGGDDVTFVDDIISEVEKGLCIDSGQIFASGFSYGGAMSIALACARPKVFRGVVSYAGAEISGCDGGTEPVAFLGIHGTQDGRIGAGVGQGVLDRFVRNNGCTAKQPAQPSPGSLKHVVTDFEGCKPGYPVEWAAFDGGHTPGPIDGGGDGYRTWTKELVWKFMTQFGSSASSGPASSPESSPASSPSPDQSSPSPGEPSPSPGEPTPSPGG